MPIVTATVAIRFGDPKFEAIEAEALERDITVKMRVRELIEGNAHLIFGEDM